MTDSITKANSTPISTPNASMTDTSMATPTTSADLRQRAVQIDTADYKTYNVYEKLLAWRNLAYEAIEQLEIMERKPHTNEVIQKDQGQIMGNSEEFDACPDAVKWHQKPLDCVKIELGGKGKFEVRDCEIGNAGASISRSSLA